MPVIHAPFHRILPFSRHQSIGHQLSTFQRESQYALPTCQDLPFAGFVFVVMLVSFSTCFFIGVWSNCNHRYQVGACHKNVFSPWKSFVGFVFQPINVRWPNHCSAFKRLRTMYFICIAGASPSLVASPPTSPSLSVFCSPPFFFFAFGLAG